MIDVSRMSVRTDGLHLKVTLPLTFDTSFGGPKAVYAIAVDTAQHTNGWQTMGAWIVK